jgi:hypothetical protein
VYAAFQANAGNQCSTGRICTEENSERPAPVPYAISAALRRTECLLAMGLGAISSRRKENRRQLFFLN